MALRRDTPVRGRFIRTQGTGLAKEELLTVEGRINAILPDARFGVTPGNEHPIIASTAGKMRRPQLRPVFAGRVPFGHAA